MNTDMRNLDVVLSDLEWQRLRRRVCGNPAEAWAEAHAIFTRMASRESDEVRPLAVSQKSLRAHP